MHAELLIKQIRGEIDLSLYVIAVFIVHTIHMVYVCKCIAHVLLVNITVAIADCV